MLFPKFSDPVFKTKTILRHRLPEGSHKAGASKGLGTGEGASVCDVCSLMDGRGTSRTPRQEPSPTGCRVAPVTGATSIIPTTTAVVSPGGSVWPGRQERSRVSGVLRL